MIELQNIEKSFDRGRSFVVSDVSLSVGRGQLLCLVGESGSGKTTTLKMINRIQEPSSGTIRVNNENILHQDPVNLRRSIGYVFQGIGLFPHYTVLDNVAAVPSLLRWERPLIDSRCEEILEMVGLPINDYGGRYPSQLSGGQQQRVGVARALVAKPEVLLMDEPFGALDPITRAGLQEEFMRIQRLLNLTVIMVTHDMTEALLMADQIAVMKNGQILQNGPPKELFNCPEHDYVRKLIEIPRNSATRLEKLMDSI